MKKVLSAALCVVLTLSLSIPALAAEPVSEVETAADYLFQHGIMPVSYTHLTLPTNREV